MADIDLSVGGTGQPWGGGAEFVTVMDFSYSAVTDPQTAAGGDVKLIALPVGSVILGGYVNVTTAEGGVATGDFGVASAGTGLASNVNLNATGYTAFAAGQVVTAAAGGLWLSPDNDIDAVVCSGRIVVAFGPGVPNT